MNRAKPHACSDCGVEISGDCSLRCPPCKAEHDRKRKRAGAARYRALNREEINRKVRARETLRREAAIEERERVARETVQRIRERRVQEERRTVPIAWTQPVRHETRGRPATQEPKRGYMSPGTPEAQAAVEAARYLVEQMSNPYGKRRSVEG